MKKKKWLFSISAFHGAGFLVAHFLRDNTGTTEPPATGVTTITFTSSDSIPTPTLAPSRRWSPIRPTPPMNPAFPGQTRISGVETTTPYVVEILTKDLVSPWAVSPLPDGRLVITEKAGAIRIADAMGRLRQPIGGFPPVDDRGQGGLLDVAPSPNFTADRMLYFTLAESTPAGSLTAVARGRLSDDETNVEQVEILWRAIPYYDNSMHFGGRLVFDPTAISLFRPESAQIWRPVAGTGTRQWVWKNRTYHYRR